MQAERVKPDFFNDNGMTLVEVLIAVGIMAIMSAAMMSLMTVENKEVQSLKERLAASDFQQQLIRSFTDGTVCKSVLTASPQTFVTTVGAGGVLTAPDLPLGLTAIPMNTSASAPNLVVINKQVSPISNTLIATGAQVTGISGSSNAGVGRFVANFQVNFDQTRLVRQIHPATVQISLVTQSTGSSQTILNCASSAGGNVLTYQIGCQNGGPNPVAQCTPPSCAAGEIDRGTGCEMTSNMYGGDSGYGSINCSRTCTAPQATAIAVYVLSCPYGGDSINSPSVHTCTPPSCYGGDQDKGS